MEEEWTDTNAEIEQILTEFPGARNLADLISASSISEFREVAQAIDKKVRDITQDSNTQQPSSPRSPKPRSERAVTVEEAISAKSWPDYLHAKWEAAGRD